MISASCCPPRPHDQERPDPSRSSRPPNSYTTSRDTTARYVIGQDGTILCADVNPDYTHRREPEDPIPALQKAAARNDA